MDEAAGDEDALTAMKMEKVRIRLGARLLPMIVLALSAGR